MISMIKMKFRKKNIKTNIKNKKTLTIQMICLMKIAKWMKRVMKKNRERVIT